MEMVGRPPIIHLSVIYSHFERSISYVRWPNVIKSHGKHDQVEGKAV